jgi:hypothetical protein
MSSNISIKELRVQYISKKVDKYENMISYFKIIDSAVNKKLKIVNKLSDTLYKPFWKTDKNEIMLKVKTKHVDKNDLVKDMLYDCNVELVAYFEEKSVELKGYYAKMRCIKDVKEIEVSDEDSA